MAGGTFTDSGLRWNDPGETDWLIDLNYNIERLYNTLLKISGMLDVNETDQDHQSAIIWDGSEFDMRHVPWKHEFYTTTTTSTTSTTSTTTT